MPHIVAVTFPLFFVLFGRKSLKQNGIWYVAMSRVKISVFGSLFRLCNEFGKIVLLVLVMIG